MKVPEAGMSQCRLYCPSVSVWVEPMIVHCSVSSVEYERVMVLSARGLLFWSVRVPLIVRVEPTW